MPRAIWNDVVLAERDAHALVQGTKAAAASIRDHVAFWRGVRVAR